MKYPRKAMRLGALLFAMMIIGFVAKAQTASKASYTYYFEVSSVDTKAEAKLFEACFAGKTSVEKVQGYGTPRAFYILYAKSPLTSATVSSWVKKEWSISGFKPFTVTKESIVKLKTEKLLKKAN